MEPCQEPTEIDIAKMAAIIDCEALISIRGGKNRRNCQLYVTVGSTAFELIYWCQDTFGGNITENFYQKPRGPTYAPAKRWTIQDRSASELLIKCLPEFIIKRGQAELAI